MGWGCAGGGSWPSNLRADSHLCTWMLGVPPLQHPWRVGKEGGGDAVCVMGYSGGAAVCVPRGATDREGQGSR